MEIGYWNLRGLVGFCRLLAEYTGEPVKWVNYDINTERAKWATDKADALPKVCKFNY